MLVAVGKYEMINVAQRALLKLMATNDDKISDLSSVEVDTTLFDTVSN